MAAAYDHLKFNLEAETIWSNTEEGEPTSDCVSPSQHRVVAPNVESDVPGTADPPRCAGRSRRVLTLALKRRWFEAIKDGSKREEYRLRTDYWKKRLEGKEYDLIEFTLGYPKRDDMDRRMTFRYDGFYSRELTHEEWNNEPKQVFAIRIGDAVANGTTE